MPTSGRPKRLDAAILLVKNLDASTEFYQDVLRLSLKFKGPTWAEFVLDDFHLTLRKKFPPRGQADSDLGTLGVSLTFEVENLEDHVAWLKLHRVEIVGGIHENDFVRTVFFPDPDGYILGLREYQRQHIPA